MRATRLALVAAVGAVLGAGLVRACAGSGPTSSSDQTQAVRDSAARAGAADSARWAVERQGFTRTVDRLTRERDSAKAARRPVRVVYVPVPDSGMANNPSSAAGLSDSTPMVALSDYQSLERENTRADSIIDVKDSIIRADEAEYARLGALRAFEDSTHKEAYGKLARDLAKARRTGPAHDTRFGAGATLTANADAALLVAGPTVVERRRVWFLEIEGSATVGPSAGVVASKPTSGLGVTVNARITF